MLSTRYILPQDNPNPIPRALEVAINRAGFSYDPQLIGDSFIFPGGTMGGQRVKAVVHGFIKNTIDERFGAVVKKLSEV